MNYEFIHWCDARTADCMAQQRLLSADGRGDEARFMQIRANVYGICRSVYAALKGDLPTVLERLTSIPAAWEKNLEQAEKHGDTEAAHIERIKLETVAAIRHYVTNLQEATTHD
ncbi:MAG: hypothetical protein IJ343_05090 [Clostridia bacterium]|nr:hypothetical protein [Clostridia bacterium]